MKEQGSFVLKGPFSDPLRKSRVWESASLKQSTQIPLEKSSLATTLRGNTGLRDKLTTGTDLPENTHPNQETGLHISSPYSHSWGKTNRSPGWFGITWKSSRPWDGADSGVGRNQPKRTAPHESHHHAPETGTPSRLWILSRETGQAKTVLQWPLTCFCRMLHTGSQAPMVLNCNCVPKSSPSIWRRRVTWSALTWLWQSPEKLPRRTTFFKNSLLC